MPYCTPPLPPFGTSDREWDRPEYRIEKVVDHRGETEKVECVAYVRSSRLRRGGEFMGYCDNRDQFFFARARVDASKEREKMTGRKPVQFQLRDGEQHFTEADLKWIEENAVSYVVSGDIKKAVSKKARRA